MNDGMVEVKYCKSEAMLADLMTKGLYGEKFTRLRRMIRVEKMTD